MPISNILWGTEKDNDLHVIIGQPSPDLTDGYLFFKETNSPDDKKNAKEYLAENSDVRLKFTPLFKGTNVLGLYSGHGIVVNTTNGMVMLANPLPTLRKNNFILEIEAIDANTNQLIAETRIRVHVHQSITQMWLTPAVLEVRNFPATPPAQPSFYSFSVRAQFDDGVVGDITQMPGINWSPAAHVMPNGKLSVNPGEHTEDTFLITAQLPAAVGGASASATKKIAIPWDIAHPVEASIVVGGKLPKKTPVNSLGPATPNPEKVPNVLFLGDGFMEEDREKFKMYVNSLVFNLKCDPINRPYNLLATSMNFWSALAPSNTPGISIRGEVYPVGTSSGLKAKYVPSAQKPPVNHNEIWGLDHLIYMVGLPIPADDPSNTTRSNEIIKAEWQSLINTDPVPKVTDQLINRWRSMAKRSLVDEVDSVLGVGSGRPVSDSNSDTFHLNPSRVTRENLNFLLRSLKDPRGIPVDKLWTINEGRLNDFDLVCLIVAGHGRAVNDKGYFIVNVLDEIKIAPIAGKNAFSCRIESADLPNNANFEIGALLAHELTHSFTLGDEYGEFEGPPSEADSSSTEANSNVTLEHNAMKNGKLHGDEIKWNWHRIQKAGVLDQVVDTEGNITIKAIESAGENKYKIRLLFGHGFQFKIGERVHLRFREYRSSLMKKPRMSAPFEIVEPTPTASEIHIRLITDVVFNYPNVSVPLPIEEEEPELGLGRANFPPGSIVFVPTPAPSAVKTAEYPYAEMVAKNIKDFISDHGESLTAPDVTDTNAIQIPHIPGVSLPDCFSKNKPRIVGLYRGGHRYHKGVFHPTGHCVMGDHLDKAKKEQKEFCAICRFILVDQIDPTLHSENDKYYKKVYPLR